MFGWLERFLFAPEGGGWAYPYVQRPDGVSLLAVLGLVPLVLWLWQRTAPQIDTRPRHVLTQWLVAALAVQAVCLLIAPYPFTAKIDSVAANGFYAVSKQYAAADFLRQFNTIAETLPMHVRANLPGKVLLFHLLRTVSDRPSVLGVLIVVLSTLGGLLVYLVGRQWFASQHTAIVAAIFYWLFPARIVFLPLPNTISPLLMLTALALVGAWKRTGAAVYALMLGLALYALAIFDPLPLVAGLCGLAVLVPRTTAVSYRQLLQLAAATAAGCLATHALVFSLLHFDIVSAYGFAFRDATAFNAAQRRPYWFWLAHNLKDFAIAMGIGQFVIVAAAAHRWLRAPAALIGVSIVLCLLLVDVLGINRGEVARLWVFLGVLFQLLAAYACNANRRAIGVIIALSAAQTALCIRSIAWVVP